MIEFLTRSPFDNNLKPEPEQKYVVWFNEG